MKIEIEIPDAEFTEVIRRGGISALSSPKMGALILRSQEEKIAAIIQGMDVSALVKHEIDAVMAHVIQGAVSGRIRRIVRPIIEQEIAKLRGEAALGSQINPPTGKKERK